MTLSPGTLLDKKDKMLLEILHSAACVDRRNIFVVSKDEFYLDAFFLELYETLKNIQDLSVTRMFQPDVEGIVGWFNKLLAELSIDEARNSESRNKTVIFMPEITNANLQDWISCESLISAFPGANVSLIAFGRADKINATTLKNIGSKNQNRLIRLPELSPDRVEPYFRELKETGELSTILSGLTDSPWVSLAKAILDEPVTEPSDSFLATGVTDLTDYEPVAPLLEVQTANRSDIQSSSTSSISTNEVEQDKRALGWLGQFSVATSIFFTAFVVLFVIFDYAFAWGVEFPRKDLLHLWLNELVDLLGYVSDAIQLYFDRLLGERSLTLAFTDR